MVKISHQFQTISQVETPDEFCRVFEVGKEHRDLLALACQDWTSGEDLVGQVLGRVDAQVTNKT